MDAVSLSDSPGVLNIADGKGQTPLPYTPMTCNFGNLKIDAKLSTKGSSLNFKNVCTLILEGGWILVVIFFFITTGTLNTFYFKLQNESNGKFGTLPPYPYTHPFTQSFQMFLGMTVFCLGSHWIKEKCVDPIMARYRKKKQQDAVARPQVESIVEANIQSTPVAAEDEEEKKEPRPINQLLFLAPSVCDLVASTILSFALILTYASIYQMLQCITVVFTFLLSITILRHNFYKFPHKWIGVIFVFVGSALVGLNTVIYPQGSTQTATARSPFVGAMLVIVACFIYAMFYIFEEIFLTGYDTDPLQVPGYEGFWGLVLVLIILFCMYWMPGADYGRLENFPAAFAQTFQSKALVVYIVLLICNIGLYNALGNVITQTLSCATRAVIDQVRAMLIWIIQMARRRQDFTGLQLGGFLLMFLGVLIYNEIAFNVLLPCYMKWVERVNKADEEKKKEAAAKKKREQRKKLGLSDDDDFVIPPSSLKITPPFRPSYDDASRSRSRDFSGVQELQTEELMDEV